MRTSRDVRRTGEQRRADTQTRYELEKPNPWPDQRFPNHNAGCWEMCPRGDVVTSYIADEHPNVSPCSVTFHVTLSLVVASVELRSSMRASDEIDMKPGFSGGNSQYTAPQVVSFNATLWSGSYLDTGMIYYRTTKTRHSDEFQHFWDRWPV